MKKNMIAVGLVLLMSPFALAENQTYTIETACLSKLTQFAGVFAEANKMLYDAEVQVAIKNITVNPHATTIGESGYANGKGTFEIEVTEEQEVSSTTTEFKFMFASEPHCAIIKVEVSGYGDK